MQLDDEQHLAVLAPRGPVCILAGAGTGKTRTITHRISRLIHDGQVNLRHILAVTFTKRAAGEMRERLTHMGVGQFGRQQVQASTFHSAALRQLRYFWPQMMGDVPWSIIDRDRFGVVARAADHCGADSSKEAIRDFLTEIDWAKSELLDAETYQAGVARLHREPPADAATVAQVMARYEELKRRSDGMLLDFNDLLLYMSAALDEFPGIAEEFRASYRSFVVDEYQDVTPLQQRLLDGWLGERDDLTVVGDPNQTIYSFNGASPEFLVSFRRRFPHATFVTLVRDYRSTPEIVSCANKVIADAKGDVSQPSMQLRGQQQRGSAPQILRFDDDFQEAEEVATAIAADIVAGQLPENIAILYRTNAQSALFEQALEERHIPYQVRGGEGFFQRTEIQQAYRQLMRLGTRTDLPAEMVGPHLVTLVRASLQSLGLTSEEPTGQQARERWQALTALVTLVEDITDAAPSLTLDGLLRELQDRADNRQPPTVRGVTLASIHAAKGLEWDTVYVVGLVEGTLPIRYVFDDNAPADALEEERRLLYVAITRARYQLTLTWGAARRAGGKARQRCRFLDSIDPPKRTDPRRITGNPQRPSASRSGTVGHAGAVTSSKQWKREALEAMSYRQQELFEALVAWRKATAAEIGKPAFVVFTDRTLIEVALHSPRELGELSGIHGIGQAKLQTYGEDLLRLVADSL